MHRGRAVLPKMKKESYVSPETEVIRFEVEVIIMTSRGEINYGKQDEAETPIIPITKP